MTEFNRFGRVPLRSLVPNLVTLLAVCSGLTAIRMAIEGRFELAVACIVFAAILDALDGRLARALKAETRFGAELDSLADFVNFGVAPAVVIYIWVTGSLGAIGWLGALVFAIACALRLARFNVALDDPDAPAWSQQFFAGVPAPAGALMALLPMYLSIVFNISRDGLAVPVLVHLVVVGMLMSSRIPTFSAKKSVSAVPRDMVVPILSCAALFLALLASFPFAVLLVGTLIYVALIPFAVIRYRALSREDAAQPVQHVQQVSLPEQGEMAPPVQPEVRIEPAMSVPEPEIPSGASFAEVRKKIAARNKARGKPGKGGRKTD
ncbi:MAG: phosphatidylcholine/phosphatidylserine synthase [Pseudomonadota bacterium]